MAGKNDWECRIELDRRPNGLLTLFGSYRMEKRGDIGNPLGVTAAAIEAISSSHSGFDSDFATVCVQQSNSRKRLGSYSVSLGTSVLASLQSSRLYFRLLRCRSSDQMCARKFHASAWLLTELSSLSSRTPRTVLRD